MSYGQLKGKTLKWFTQFAFGLDPKFMPAKVVITPYKVDDFFKNFRDVIANRGAVWERVGNNYLTRKRQEQILFCEGGVGASNFADSSYILCHCRNVEEIVFVGTGGGIGKNVKSGDINMPTSCVRLDKVLEIFLPADAPAEADLDLVQRLRDLIAMEIKALGVHIHTGTHATMPFFLSETKKLLTNLQKRGVLSVDMELSVLYALANHYHKKVSGIVRIGDLPLAGLPTWKSRGHNVQLKMQVHTRILNSLINCLFS